MDDDFGIQSGVVMGLLDTGNVVVLDKLSFFEILPSE